MEKNRARHTHLLFILFPLAIFVSAIFFFVFAGGGDVYTKDLGKGGVHVVELRENGFYPNELVIQEGGTVTFTSSGNKDFWPASDPHPTHDYMSSFDPGRPLMSNERWSYTFHNSSGTWRYHDHLNVSYRGAIIVLRKETEKVAGNASQDTYCDGKCFDNLIRGVVKREGIDAAFALFSKTFETGKLPRSCHWTAHQIGEEAYHLFEKGIDFPISHATSYCGYGFFHGFLESLLRSNPDVDYALSFCDKVGKQLGKMGVWNCYHGIGHGFTEDPPDPRVRGNFEAMVEPGIKMCEYLFEDSFRNLNLCLTGVFTVPAGFAADHAYGLELDPQDPFAYCKPQPYRYHKACFGEFAPKLDEILKGDISGLPQFVGRITDSKTQRLVVWVAPSVTMARHILDDDHTHYITSCRNGFSGRLRNICFGGTILGFFNHGEPEKQYVKALQFCSSRAFMEDEKEFCFEEALRQARQNYGPGKMESICKSVPKPYKRFCYKSFNEPPYDDPVFD